MENKIKYTEIFYSFQGEGRYVGVPSVFLRTFGCNFECRGFGQPRGQLCSKDEMPHNIFPIEGIKSVKCLSVFDIGCDSSASWSNRYKHLAPYETVEEITEKIFELIPESYKFNNKQPHLVITGGEPLLGWQRVYPTLLSDDIIIANFSKITFETNGTQILNNEFIKYLNCEYEILQQASHIEEVTWMVSPKLSISGESFPFKTIIPTALKSMNEVTRSKLYLKFVVRDKHCIEDVERALNAYAKAGVEIDGIYLMPEGATIDGLELTEKEVAELCLKYGYMFSPRLHVHVFGNRWGT